MKFLFECMKKVCKAFHTFLKVRKQFQVWNCFWWYEKVPFGYEKKFTFKTFHFHTLGYENIGFFLREWTEQQLILPRFLSTGIAERVCVYYCSTFDKVESVFNTAECVFIAAVYKAVRVGGRGNNGVCLLLQDLL